jgi:hypothetical protein
MGLSLILPMANRAVFRARFFQTHGVTLESHARSSSGVREADGMVVFAMPVERVRVDAWGCSCLLWTGCDRLLDDAITVVTLRHCRLAVQHGIAEGFLLGKKLAPMERQELLALRVVKVGREYWAKWGHAVRAEPAWATACNDGARAQ